MNHFIQALLNDYAKHLENGLTIEEQKAILADYAKKNGYKVEWESEKEEL